MMKLFNLCLLFLHISLFTTVYAAGPNRHAVVIGIGEYKDKAWPRVHGDSDIAMVCNMLKKAGYTDIATLSNRKATKRAILSAFESMAERCNRGDHVYIHFSGHGQQMTDLDGDEEDGWDEAWVAYDAMYAYSDSYKGENHLVDDEIAVWMTRIRNKIGSQGRLLVVVDACHSGDSSRDLAAPCVRGAKDKFVIPLDKAPKKIGKAKEDWLTLTACKDFQINCEFRSPDGKYYGMLSYALCNTAAAAADNIKFLTLLQKFVNKHRSKLPQDVTLSGKTDSHTLSDFF